MKGFGPGLIVLDENYRRQVGAVDLVILCAKLERLAAMTFGLVFVELLFDILLIVSRSKLHVVHHHRQIFPLVSFHGGIEGYVSARTGPQPEPVNHYGQPPRRSLEEKCGMKVSAPCGLVQFSPTQ